jgi:hypothetical protein
MSAILVLLALCFFSLLIIMCPSLNDVLFVTQVIWQIPENLVFLFLCLISLEDSSHNCSKFHINIKYYKILSHRVGFSASTFNIA